MRTQGLIVGLAALCVGALASGCALLPGEAGLQSIETDRELGQEVAKEVEAEMGLVEGTPLAGYLEAVGRRLVAGHPDRRFEYRFQIVDQAEANAFAAPGGMVYVSRGLLALSGSEDELAGVLSHEVIHVSRRHTAQQLARARTPTLLGLPGQVVGRVLSRDLGKIVNAPVNTLGSAFIAKHSREDEFEADRLGQQLAAQAGYDPGALATILDRLERADRLRSEEEWRSSFFDTHPSTPDRLGRLGKDALAIAWSRQPGVARDAPEFLRRLDGLLVGANPSEGVIQGRRFLHPVLDFSLTFPQGWKAMNTRQALVAVTPKKEALLVLGVLEKTIEPGKAAAAMTQAMEEEFRIRPTRSEAVRLGQLPAHVLTYTDRTGREPMDLHFLWVAYSGKTYQFVALAPERYRTALREVALSFQPLTPAERSSITEKRLRVVAARAGETLEQLSARTRNAWNAATTAVANSISASRPLTQGQLVKIAVVQPYQAPAAGGPRR